METLRIKWLKPHPAYSYSEGNNADLTPEQVEPLVLSGHVILFPGENEPEVNPLPEDLPCRELLFENGFDTLEKIKSAGESLTEIKGIGKKTFEDITSFISA